MLTSIVLAESRLICLPGFGQTDTNMLKLTADFFPGTLSYYHLHLLLSQTCFLI